MFSLPISRFQAIPTPIPTLLRYYLRSTTPASCSSLSRPVFPCNGSSMMILRSTSPSVLITFSPVHGRSLAFSVALLASSLSKNRLSKLDGVWLMSLNDNFQYYDFQFQMICLHPGQSPSDVLLGGHHGGRPRRNPVEILLIVRFQTLRLQGKIVGLARKNRRCPFFQPLARCYSRNPPFCEATHLSQTRLTSPSLEGAQIGLPIWLWGMGHLRRHIGGRRLGDNGLFTFNTQGCQARRNLPRMRMSRVGFLPYLYCSAEYDVRRTSVPAGPSEEIRTQGNLRSIDPEDAHPHKFHR